MEITQLPIAAYLVPDPLDEYNSTEPEWLEWIPGFNKDTEEDPVYDEGNIERYEEIEKMVQDHFRNALENLWPLLNKIHFKSLQIAIDYSNMINCSDRTLAAFHYDRSKMTEGVYVFTMHGQLLHFYLNHKYKNEDLDFFKASIWEHEIIHLLDHTKILMSCLWGSSEIASENYKYYILKFREEGLADLYYLLNGHRNINTLAEAKILFIEKVNLCKNRLELLTETSKETRDEIFSGRDFYDIGPWLILDLIKSLGADFYEEIVNDCINKTENGIAVEKEKIIEVLKIALSLNIEDFLGYTSTLLSEKKEIK